MVQNAIYITFTRKTKSKLGIVHENIPTQYLFFLPDNKFCKAINTKLIADNTKYTKAGEHNFFKSFTRFIYKLYKEYNL